jgi:hypothetical protein
MKASYEVLSIPGSVRVQPTINKFDGDTPDKQILIATKIVSVFIRPKNCVVRINMLSRNR